MANMMYALMVQDFRSDASIRARLDDILAGRLDPAVTTSIEPEWANMEPTPEDMAKLRESWGTSKQAIEGKAALDDLLRNTT